MRNQYPSILLVVIISLSTLLLTERVFSQTYPIRFDNCNLDFNCNSEDWEADELILNRLDSICRCYINRNGVDVLCHIQVEHPLSVLSSSELSIAMYIRERLVNNGVLPKDVTLSFSPTPPILVPGYGDYPVRIIVGILTL
jgi:hypothetical protein